MVVQRTVNKLRERSEEERVAVASSIAIGVVALLLVGWVAFFLHGLGGGEPVQVAAPEPVAQTPTTAPSQSAALQWEETIATTSIQENATTTLE